MFHPVSSVHQDAEDACSDASEGMDLPVRREQAGKEQSVLLPCPLYRQPVENVAQIKGGSFYLKIPGLKGNHQQYLFSVLITSINLY